MSESKNPMLDDAGNLVPHAEIINVIRQEPGDFILILKDKILPELKNYVELMHEALPSEQFQIMVMDVENMLNHVNDWLDRGPKAPFKDIPLEDSMLEDGFDFSHIEEEEQTPGPIISEHH